MQYDIGDKVLYPMHGAGEIVAVEEKEILGQIQSYYILKLPNGGMKVMVPTLKLEEIGVRDIIDSKKASEVIKNFKGGFEEETEHNWNKRYRDNMAKLKTGDICRVLEVVKSLVMRDKRKGLSTGERKMLTNSKQILFSELILASEKSEEELECLLNGACEEEFEARCAVNG